MGQLAELLSISPRTLTRYLANEGHTLRDLANDVRHRRACEMLSLELGVGEGPLGHHEPVWAHQPTVPPAFSARLPPSTGSVTPVTIEAASDAR